MASKAGWELKTIFSLWLLAGSVFGELNPVEPLVAIRTDDVSVLANLLQDDDFSDWRDELGFSLLHYAVFFNASNTVSYLTSKSKYDVNALAAGIITPLDFVQKRTCNAVSEIITSHGGVTFDEKMTIVAVAEKIGLPFNRESITFGMTTFPLTRLHDFSDSLFFAPSTYLSKNTAPLAKAGFHLFPRDRPEGELSFSTSKEQMLEALGSHIMLLLNISFDDEVRKKQLKEIFNPFRLAKVTGSVPPKLVGALGAPFYEFLGSEKHQKILNAQISDTRPDAVVLLVGRSPKERDNPSFEITILIDIDSPDECSYPGVVISQRKLKRP
jgi:hypothetical protein